MKIKNKLAIYELLAQAAYSFDERQLKPLKKCFSKDATMLVCITGQDDVGPFEGRHAIMGLMKATLDAQTDVRRHVISNIFFSSTGKNCATVLSNLVVFSVDNGKIEAITSGLYTDRVRKQGDNWKIVHRRLDLDLPF